ncbi:MAG: phosphatase PAP2 family protein [Clostridiales bacterium]|nr:phosphatase PAP2 family protein [Clostridiales bacterium]
MDAVLKFDWTVFQWVEKNLWNPVLDKIFPIITVFGNKGLFWIILALVLCMTKKYRRVGLIMAVAIILDGVSVNLILKNVFERPRPFDLEAWKGVFQYPELIKKPSDYSFPSGHTVVCFAGAVSLFAADKKWMGVAGIILAILVGFSRIYLHVHYCTDVLAGIVIGILCGVIAMLIVNSIDKKIQQKKLEKL